MPATSQPRRSRLRLSLRTLAASSLIVAFGVFTASAAADQCEEIPLPPQGMYEGCSPGATPTACIAHLVEIREAGFRYVLNYSAWYGSPSALLHYAEAAQSLGLQLIWPLNNPAWLGSTPLAKNYSSLAAGRQFTNRQFTAYAVGLVANLPSTWGFYIGDESAEEDLPAVGALSLQVRALAPQKKQLFVSRPGEHQLRPFLNFADVAGVDSYPVGSGDPRVSQVAGPTSQATLEAGVETAMVLQAFSWSEYEPSIPPDFPTERQMQKMRNAAVRIADPSMILWYSYQDIVRSDDPQGHWEDLKRAAFSPVKGKCELAATGHAGGAS